MKLALALIPAALLASPALAQSTSAMPGMSAEQHAAMDATAEGTGQIKSVDAKAGTITIHHGPIAAIGWPAMTMSFKASPEVLKAAKAGQTVKFTLQPQENLVVAIQPQ